MPQTFHADETEAGQRLDRVLVRRWPDRSRAQLQKLVEAGLVQVNGQAASKHRALRPGDVVTVSEPPPEPPPDTVVPEPRVIFEDDELLVLNKPAGLIVHPGAGVRGPTLIDWLRSHVPDIKGVGDDPEQRPGIVHRLDQDVSGIMVIAKTQPTSEHLKRQFQDRQVEKEYLALVHGVPQPPTGTIDLNLERSKRQHGRMAARPTGGEGRTAITHYAVERVIGQQALLRIRIETGRTHQIRVHLKALGHPVVGDQIYTTKPHRTTQPDLDRPFLHAYRLAFTDRHGHRREFTAPLPDELERRLKA